MALAGAAGGIASAYRPSPHAPARHPTGSWGRIQSQILDGRCTTCHTANGSAVAQSGLVLDGDAAYEQLVGAKPRGTAARADGLLRVLAGRPERSLLHHKLVWNAGHHAHGYGAPMPLGGEPLSRGEVEFVRRWIAAGAPRVGEVADTLLLRDHTPQGTTRWSPLAPPARGVQLRIAPFQVWQTAEREIFVRRRVGNREPLYVNRVEVQMRTGSHHVLVHTFRDEAAVLPPFGVVRDLRAPAEAGVTTRAAYGVNRVLFGRTMANHVFFTGSMAPYTDIRFPAGVALRLPAGATVDLNTHYTRATRPGSVGEAQINLHEVDSARVRHVARVIDWQNRDLALPPRQRTTVSKTFITPTAMRVFMLTSHMHKRGERFVIRVRGGARDGEEVYRNETWAHPAITSYEVPISLAPGEGLTSEITYNNDTDRTIRLGMTSEDEMGIIFGYWY